MIELVKTVRIGLDDIEHEEFSIIKGEKTWREVLIMGLEAIQEKKRKEANTE